MHWRKYDLWKAGSFLVGVLLLLLFAMWISVSSVHAQLDTLKPATRGAITAQATPTVDVTIAALQKEQLTQQIADGQHTFANLIWNNAVALLSILVVVIGGLTGYLRWLEDQRNLRRLAAFTDQSGRDITADNQSETSLQTYIDKMSELLLNNHLHESKPDDEVQQIARLRTLTVLPQLNSTRKKSVIRFLYESGLINTSATIVYLNYADLRHAGLLRSTLTNSNLSKSNLSYADLSEAELDKADLSGAKLDNADLSHADLTEANLSGASLTRANLSHAKFTGADLSGVNLSAANLSNVDIENACSLEKSKLHAVKGLTEDQLKICNAKGAIIDEDITTDSSQPVLTPPSQTTNVQTPSVPPAQGSSPTPDTSGSSASVSQPSNATQTPAATPAQAVAPSPNTDGSSNTSAQPNTKP